MGICKTCIRITFTDVYNGVGRCGKWNQIVNLLEDEPCHTDVLPVEKTFTKPSQLKFDI